MKIKKDRFYRSRGGTTELYDIVCSNCHKNFCLYQKDGKGNLLRLYKDRILRLYELKVVVKPEQKNLVCSCRNIIAVGMYYKKEGRLAYRLIKGRYNKVKYYD